MATLTMTPSRFGNSFSGSQSQYRASAPSMADTLPSIDFGFNELRERMAQFTMRFDDFIERGRKRVLEERNAFRMNVAEMEDVQRTRKIAITELESKSSTHAQTLAKEAAETDEMHEAIRTLSAQKEEHVERRDRIKDDINSVQAIIKQKREAQAVHQRALESQARHNIPELRFWEHCLGLRIEASGFGVEDQLRFVFGCVDERDQSKEVWFELLMGAKEYEVPNTKPKLEKERLEETIDRLNETKEVGPFLKAMRSMFVETLKS
ncbi:kinetochore-associated Ndc80 complex subunit spc25 [Vermiconidia calcicola]|uniref:Kinetochore-associated Ndc80 complex subunit spc25 n=1 Tax=Vermiconidia calcicola TaxID=1690605 RepID=A0ACC3NZJ5_9PEZI|nr:kinetochore-associated Ndc80 complex subunit spc25 [Vermiconidia calcicola]